jgi:hypothetical protein
MTQGPVCLLLRGVPLTRDVTLSLFAVAQFMITKGRNTLKFSSNGFSGEVETSLRYQCLGTFGGYVFRACVHAKKGKTEVDYLVEPSDLLSFEIVLSPPEEAHKRRIDQRTLN